MSNEALTNEIWPEGPMSSTDQTDMSPQSLRDSADQDMQGLLASYKTRMLNGNRNFIVARIHEIEARRLDSERDKLNLMARFWFHTTRWPRIAANPFALRMRINNVDEQTRAEQDVQTLEEVKFLSHPQMGGLDRPTLPSFEAVDIAIAAMEQVAREYIEPRIAAGLSHVYHGGFSLGVPIEMRYFFKHANGVTDPDFRYEGICPWSLFDGLDTSSVGAPEVFKEDVASYLRSLRADLDRFPPEFFVQLDVEAGFYAGTAERYNETYWSSYYLFCRRKSGSDYTSPGRWAWRIVFFCHHGIAQIQCDQTPVFESMATFLMWYSAWITSPLTCFQTAELWQWIDDESDSDYDETGLGGLVPGGP